ncbi:hypothetical protein LCGC14_1491420 [marine sediment metagenome]|uniref:Uncharacterized protein n=1 Tax=marine sediment metagenome TaxID=412755 RepID=A0A0F9J6M0_9ZZZZ
MTLQELIAKVPEPWRPIVAEYGPALLAMSAEELWAWVRLLAEGKDDQAYRAVLARLDDAELLAEWDRLAEQWHEANRRNAARADLSRRAAQAVLRVLLTAALTMVGL